MRTTLVNINLTNFEIRVSVVVGLTPSMLPVLAVLTSHLDFHFYCSWKSAVVCPVNIEGASCTRLQKIELRQVNIDEGG